MRRREPMGLDLAHYSSMAPWGWVAVAYGAVLALAALGLEGVRRRLLIATLCVAYALIGVGAATLTTQFWVQLLVPGGLLLCGYWLSGFLFGSPQPWLERWLLHSDRVTFDTLRVNRMLCAAPRVVLELLEASYAADYVVVGGGALLAARFGVAAVSYYWSLVLAAELACYAALPFLRSRPPRTLEGPGVMARRKPALRWLNVAILDRASVQANTLPSGHVAGALAAALALMPLSVTLAWSFMLVAVLIAIAATLGRYHYAVDCVSGAAVAVVMWGLFGV